MAIGNLSTVAERRIKESTGRRKDTMIKQTREGNIKLLMLCKTRQTRGYRINNTREATTKFIRSLLNQFNLRMESTRKTRHGTQTSLNITLNTKNLPEKRSINAE